MKIIKLLYYLNIMQMDNFEYGRSRADFIDFKMYFNEWMTYIIRKLMVLCYSYTI